MIHRKIKILLFKTPSNIIYFNKKATYFDKNQYQLHCPFYDIQSASNVFSKTYHGFITGCNEIHVFTLTLLQQV